jgi:hypothetical protein
MSPFDGIFLEMRVMTLDEYTAVIRKLASNDGVVAHDSFWAPQMWRARFDNGLTPEEAWDRERHPALGAL